MNAFFRLNRLKCESEMRRLAKILVILSGGSKPSEHLKMICLNVSSASHNLYLRRSFCVYNTIVLFRLSLPVASTKRLAHFFFVVEFPHEKCVRLFATSTLSEPSNIRKIIKTFVLMIICSFNLPFAFPTRSYNCHHSHFHASIQHHVYKCNYCNSQLNWWIIVEFAENFPLGNVLRDGRKEVSGSRELVTEVYVSCFGVGLPFKNVARWKFSLIVTRHWECGASALRSLINLWLIQFIHWLLRNLNRKL